MKVMKTPSILKKIITAFSDKTNELRIRIMIFFLLHKNIDKTTLTHSLHALVSHPPSQHLRKTTPDDGVVLEECHEAHDGLLMHYDGVCEPNYEYEDHNKDEYEDEEDIGGGDIIQVIEDEEDEDEDEEEEEDIDQAADLFIQRFKREIQLEKQFSLERHHQLLQV